MRFQLNKLFFMSFLFISITTIYSQSSDNSELLYNRRIVWQEEEFAFRYMVEVDQLDNGNYRNFLRENSSTSSISVSLPSGEFRFRIIPYCILDRLRPERGSNWMYFDVHHPIESEIANVDGESFQIINIDDFDIRGRLLAHTAADPNAIAAVISNNEQITNGIHVHIYDNGICVECYSIKMIPIPGGTFFMGSPVGVGNDNERPQRLVTLTGFRMSVYPITQELYQAVMGTNPSYFHGGRGREPAAGEIQGRRPVEMVSWFDAIEFCNKLSEREGLDPAYSITKLVHGFKATFNSDKNGYRLPTEAQWEYACRAGSTTIRYFGDSITGLSNYAWYYVNSRSRTHQVGLKLPNQWGLYDMLGNVWEYCVGWGPYPNIPEIDPIIDLQNFGVVRGGSWDSYGQFLRSAFRQNVSIKHYEYFFRDEMIIIRSRSTGYGFRVVLP